MDQMRLMNKPYYFRGCLPDSSISPIERSIGQASELVLLRESFNF